MDEGRLSGGVVQDGSFVMFVKASFWDCTTRRLITFFSRPDVSPGTYVLSVLSHDYTFDQVLWSLRSCSEWVIDGFLC